MSRMWSPTKDFDAAFNRLSPEDQQKARERMSTALCIALREDDDKITLLDSSSDGIEMSRDDVIDGYRFHDKDKRPIYIGAPTFVHPS